MNNIKNIKAKVLRVDEEEHKFVIETEFSLSEKEFYDIIGEENWNTQ